MPRFAVWTLVIFVLLVLTAGSLQWGPMNHGRDWPWHDWWHSQAASLDLGS